MPVEQVIVQRVIRLYDWWMDSLYFGRRASDFRRYEPKGFMSEVNRPYDLAWNLGRVHALMRRIERGQRIDPIEIDSDSRSEVFLHDGHHRLAAAHVLHVERIPAYYRGRETDLLAYLIGDRRTRPR